MKCFVCSGVVTEISLDEDGEEHLFKCKSCVTKIVTTNRESYYAVLEKLTSDNSNYMASPKSLA